jgi:hypothetical protein
MPHFCLVYGVTIRKTSYDIWQFMRPQVISGVQHHLCLYMCVTPKYCHDSGKISGVPTEEKIAEL